MDSYVRYGPALLRKAERVLRNAEDARDVVQGVFMDLWNRGETQVELPYLFTMVTHRCLSRLRDERNRLRLLERESPLLRGPERVSLDERALGLDLLIRLVQVLDPRDQELLIFRFFDDLSLDEISDLTGTSRKTLSKRLLEITSCARRLAGDPETPYGE